MQEQGVGENSRSNLVVLNGYIEPWPARRDLLDPYRYVSVSKLLDPGDRRFKVILGKVISEIVSGTEVKVIRVESRGGTKVSYHYWIPAEQVSVFQQVLAQSRSSLEQAFENYRERMRAIYYSH